MFHNAGWTADGVTVARIVFAAAITIGLAVPSWATAAIAAAGFYICFILDCVDGNLARVQATVSYWGKFIDGLADFVFVQGAPFAVGIGMSIADGNPVWSITGALVTLTTVTSQMLRARLSFFREWMVSQSGALTDAETDRAKPARALQGRAAVVYVNGTFLAPLLLFVPVHGRALYLLAAVFVIFLTEVFWLFATTMESKAILGRPRRSIHSPSESNAAETRAVVP
jgi:phosphatidylglycerophosphate synthase